MGKLTLPSRATTPAITTLIEPPLMEAATTMSSLVPTDSLLMRQFRLFVAEVIALLASFGPETLMVEVDAATASHAAAEASDTLARLIATQTMEISRIGSPADRAAVDELRYLKAAIADELLLNHVWPGKSQFTTCLVETRLFGSSVAGDKIIDRIEALLNDASGQPSQMAPLYLFAISSEFEGRYRGPQSEAALAPLRDALFKKIYRREPAFTRGLDSQARSHGRVLSEQAYQYQLSNIVPVQFFRISRGLLAFVGVMLLLLVLSQVAWLVSSAPVRRALEPSTPVKLKQAAPSEAGRG